LNNITVIGSGFGALTAIRTLRAQDKTAQLTLISPKADFVFMPSLIWLPSGIRRPESISIPLNKFFRKMRVDFHQASVTGLKDGGRTVVTSTGENITNDGLIIASGSRFIKKLPGLEHAIIPCEGISAGLKIRDRLHQMTHGTIAIGFSGNPKEPSAMRGGPMFEFLFGIDRQLRRENRRDRFKLVFFTPAEKPGARLGPKAVQHLLTEMKNRQIETHLGHKMKAFEEKAIITENTTIPADLILFMPGMTGHLWLDNTDLPRSPGGLIQADQHCRVQTMEKVYVAGDSGSFPGPEWMPKQAHMADLQAAAAVKNLLAELGGHTPKHTFKVELACIIDSHNRGILVTRTPTFNLISPPLRLLHWAKRFFEWWYIRRYK
jgi:sulfide:quinone oxidoreductase